MAYCTQADILNQLDSAALVELTDDAGAGVEDTDVVARAIADADALIDSYCQGRYTVPLSPVPDRIRMVSVDIAIYNLYSRRDDVAPEIRRDRHKDAIRWLERVSEGKITLGSATPAPDNTGHTVDIETSDRVFSRDKLKGL